SSVTCLVEQQGRLAAVALWDRVVAAMSGGINCDDVGSVSKVGAAGDGEFAVVFVEDGEPAAFGSDVEPAGGRVIGEDVGVVADALGVDGLPRVQVDRQQGGVGVAGDERKPVRGVEGEAVVVVAAGQRYPPDDGEGGRVDHGQLVAGLH